jgi:hypothetical protein
MRTRQLTWKERWASLQTNGECGDGCRWQALLEAAAIAGLQFAAAPAAAAGAAAAGLPPLLRKSIQRLNGLLLHPSVFTPECWL